MVRTILGSKVIQVTGISTNKKNHDHYGEEHVCLTIRERVFWEGTGKWWNFKRALWCIWYKKYSLQAIKVTTWRACLLVFTIHNKIMVLRFKYLTPLHTLKVEEKGRTFPFMTTSWLSIHDDQQVCKDQTMFPITTQSNWGTHLWWNIWATNARFKFGEPSTISSGVKYLLQSIFSACSSTMFALSTGSLASKVAGLQCSGARTLSR